MTSKLSMKDIEAFAKKNGYETADYGGTYEDYDVWCPITDTKNYTFTGLPYLILVKGDEIKMTTPENALEINSKVKWVEEE